MGEQESLVRNEVYGWIQQHGYNLIDEDAVDLVMATVHHLFARALKRHNTFCSKKVMANCQNVF